MNKLGITTAIASLAVVASGATMHVQARSNPGNNYSMADSLGTIRAAGQYILRRYGTDLLLDPGLKCGTLGQCRQEWASSAVALSASTRRASLMAELRAQLPGAGVAHRPDVLYCEIAAGVCRVHGATRYVQVKEPVFIGDSATVRIRVYWNAGKYTRSQVDVVQFVRGLGNDWVLAHREAHGIWAR